MKIFIVTQLVVLLKVVDNVQTQFAMQQMPSMPSMPYPQMPQMPQMPHMPMNMGAAMQAAMGHPMGMPSPMQMGPISMMQQPKMPVVVMPFRNKEKNSNRKKYKSKRRKHRPKKYLSLSSDSESGSSSASEAEFRSGKKKRGSKHSTRSRGSHKRHQVLTPVISYVTKEGYVVYQKKIKKDKAKDWLEIGKTTPTKQDATGETEESSEDNDEAVRKMLKKKLKKVKKKHKL